MPLILRGKLILNNNITKRIFIVGCPRSGTTLLQTLLMQHEDILSFPESHFFSRIFLNRNTLKTRLRVLYIIKNLYKWNQLLQKQNFKGQKIYFTLSFDGYIHQFIDLLDFNTISGNKTMWVEKTPSHLHVIENIQEYIADAKFIHMIRDGEDVVASLYDATNKYPEIWGGEYTIDDCIDRYNRDLVLSSLYSGNDNHYFISYDELVKDINDVKKVYRFLGITPPLVIKIIPNNGIVIKTEKWKENNALNKIVDTKNRKFNELFSDDEKKYIKKELLSPKDIIKSI